MQRLAPSSSASAERRLLRYKSNFGRLAGGTYEDYLHLPKDKRNVLDGTLHAVGAVGNVATNTFEAVTGDLARWIEGRKDPVPALRGHIARTREDARELLGAFKHPLSAVVTVLKLPGDLGMDAYDAFIGNDHRRSATADNASYQTAA
ncbi:MAG: hypothetical protein PHW10_04090 [Candidatus Peribacteraceae bacterium]|nr:hypothetical protein [Candidatus Peribacteraceae bacterium]